VRVFFGLACLSGCAGIALHELSPVANFPIIFGAIWLFVSLVGFTFTWNYETTKSLAESAAKIFETYESMKGEVDEMEIRNKEFEQQNQQLHENVDKLKGQETKLQDASKLINEDVKDLKRLEEMEAKMLRTALNTLKDRESLREEQEKIRCGDEIAELEWLRSETISRCRCYFQDAGESDKVVDESEFPRLRRFLRKYSSFSNEDLRFDSFVEHKGQAINRADFMITIRPMVNGRFDQKIQAVKEKSAAQAKKTKIKFDELVRDIESKLNMKK